MPSQIDEAMRLLAAEFANSPKTDRRRAVREMSSYSQWLATYQMRMAVMSVITRDPERLRDGLLAIAIDGAADVRDQIKTLSLIYHSGKKIGVDVDQLFAEISAVGEGEIRTAIAEFPNRTPHDKSIKTMGYREATDQEGFYYDLVD
jgi:hypothetical protein